MSRVQRIYRFAEVELDEALLEVRRAGIPVPLEPKPLRMLLYLVEHRDRVIPKEELLEAIWGAPRIQVSDTAVSSALKEIRRAVGDDGTLQRWIRTQKGRGYRFVGELTVDPSPARAAGGSARGPEAPPSLELDPPPTAARASGHDRAGRPLEPGRIAADTQLRCPSCNHPNHRALRRCASCGALTSPLVEERKYVSVLFARIDDPSALRAGLDPEDAASRMEPVLRAMQEAARRHQGTVNQVFSDRIRALFGAPLAQEDHALRACLAALAMLEDVRRGTGGAVKLRVAIHSGEVLLRCTPNDLSTSYDAIGEVPEVAEHIEKLAGADQVRMTAQTLRLAAGYVEGTALGALELRGLPPVEVFELLHQPLTLYSWKVRAARGLLEFVGRETEIASLLANLEGAARSEQRLVEIIGDAGIGKSRLAHECLERARALGWSVVSGAAYPKDAADAYATLARVARSWLGVGDQESREEIRERLERHVAAVQSADTAGWLAPLESLLDLPVRDDEWGALEPVQRRSRIVSTLSALASAATSERPILLFVDDLHWADEPTQHTLETLARNVSGPFLLLAAYRPERLLEWNISGSARIHLGPLSQGGGLRILDALLGPDASLDALKRRLCEHAAGNPLFLEESVHNLTDLRVLRGEPGAYRLESRLQSLDIPASLFGVIASRVDRLQWPLKQTLQTAAIIGKQFSIAVLRQLRADAADAVIGNLESLARSGFVYPEPGATDGRYSFKHALIHQVVYQGLTHGTRREMHARTVDVIEGLYRDRLAEHIGTLAEHAFAGQRWELAARYRLQSCTAAINRSASREAVAIFEQALETFAKMPPDETAQKASIDLRLAVVNALLPLGEHERLLQIVREAEKLAEGIQDERRLGSICSHLSTALWLCGENEPALQVARRGGVLALKVQNRALYLGSCYNAGVAHHGLGEYAEAIDVHSILLDKLSGKAETARAGWAGYPAVLARTYLGQSLLELGRLAEAREVLEYGCALADRLAEPFSQAMVRYAYGAWLVAEDRPDEAIALLADTIPLCVERTPTMYTPIASVLAAAHTHRGESAAALRVLAPALRPEVHRHSGQYAWIELFLTAAHAELHGGDPNAALRHASEAERLCRSNRSRGQLAYALRILAGVAATPAGSALGAAGGFERNALEIAEQLRMPLIRFGPPRRSA